MKNSTVIPVYKKGERTSIENYRPISLTPILSKIFEKVYANQIYTFLNDTRNIPSCQFGFRKGFSCEDAILQSVERIKERLDQKQFAMALFIDLSKAFDSMNHQILLRKLEEMNFCKNSLTLLRTFLQERKQQVRLRDTFSQWLKTDRGVPQGTILGPLLFLIYVIDIEKHITFCDIKQYADDTSIFAYANTAKKAKEKLQEDFNSLNSFFSSLELRINVTKTQFINFSKNQCTKHTDTILLDKKTIECSDSVDFLGIKMDYQLSFQNQAKITLRKMAIGIQTINTIKNELNLSLRIAALRALVLSQLQYPLIFLSTCKQMYKHQIEQQIRWGARVCLFKRKYDSITRDMSVHKIPTFESISASKIISYFLHAYNSTNVNTRYSSLQLKNKFTFHNRTKTFLLNTRHDTVPQNSLFYRAKNLFNNLPKRHRVEVMNNIKQIPNILQSIFFKSNFKVK